RKTTEACHNENGLKRRARPPPRPLVARMRPAAPNLTQEGVLAGPGPKNGRRSGALFWQAVTIFSNVAAGTCGTPMRQPTRAGLGEEVSIGSGRLSAPVRKTRSLSVCSLADR